MENKKEDQKIEDIVTKIHCNKCQSDSVKKNGYFVVGGERVQKYLCKVCKNNFSEKTDTVEAGEHRPELNERVIELALTGMSAKAIAEELGCAKRTVQMKIKKYVTKE